MALDPGQSVLYCTGAKFGEDNAKTIEGCTNLIREATPLLESGEPDPTGKANWYFSRGFAYARSSDYERAVADFSKAIEINPDIDGIVYHYRALARSKAGGDADQIKADRTKACSLDKKYC
ncbi:tetratricopeptide repeat protein [Methyloceanibacter methanicus]|uniref:tetratricopeptide repeat protein n=1 Tax=Methyloceanibacter methanicus TaxID=1774968 RepID=UPI0013016E66|nr:tetratricopeptide repeat protein [Methyloceanibacter methanicus]